MCNAMLCEIIRIVQCGKYFLIRNKDTFCIMFESANLTKNYKENQWCTNIYNVLKPNYNLDLQINVDHKDV